MDILLNFNTRDNETMKILGSTENKKAKNENGKNVPHLEITEVVVVHCNIQEYYIRLFPINLLVAF